MKEKALKYKKIWTLVLICTMTFIISGCGKEERDVKDLVYKGEALPCMEQLKGEIFSYTLQGDVIYIYTTEWTEKKQHFYKCKADGSDFAEILMTFPYDADEWLNYFRVSEEGRFHLLYNYYDVDAGKNGYILRTVEEDGTLIREADITDFFGRDKEEDVFVQGMELDKEGKVYLLTEKSIFLFGAEGDMPVELEEGNILTHMAVTNKGQVIVSVSSQEEFYVKTVDGENLQFGRKLEIPWKSHNDTSLISGGEHSFYYHDGDSLFGYDMHNEKSKEILDWGSSDVNTSHIGETKALADGKFVTHYYNYAEAFGETEESVGDTENALYIFSKADSKTVREN